MATSGDSSHCTSEFSANCLKFVVLQIGFVLFLQAEEAAKDGRAT